VCYYIIILLYIYYYYYYYTIIILYYTILFSSPSHSSSSSSSSSSHIFLLSPLPSQPSLPLLLQILFPIYLPNHSKLKEYTYLSNNLSNKNPISTFHLPHSFYTCRYLHILIYILSAFQTIRPRTNYRRDVSSGVVLFVWCLCFELVFCSDGWC
jgi:hypothetical protein